MKVIIGIIRAILNFIYAILKLFGVKNKVVFLSRQSNDVSVDFRLLGEEIQRQRPNFKVVFLCRKIPDGSLKKLSYIPHMLRQMYHLATSRAAVTDSYCIVLSLLKHRKGLEVVQIWHALGNMKKFGYAMLDKPEGSSSTLANAMRMHKNYDHICISSMSFSKDFLEGFGAQADQLAELPLPKTDLLTDREYAQKHKEELLRKYPVLRNKQNILYCPTFRRSDSHTENAAQALSNYINSDKYNLILSAHPVSASEAEQAKDILRFPETTFDLLFAADFVISDYSTVFYEAALLGLPIFSYAFDWQEYSCKREINFDIEHEFPSLFSGDPQKIVRAIETKSYDLGKIKAFAEKNVAVGDGQCTRRMADFILEMADKKREAQTKQSGYDRS